MPGMLRQMVYLSFWSMLLLISQCAAASNMIIYGMLARPICTVSPQSTNIEVVFPSTSSTYLYLNARSQGQDFKIVLSDCEERWGGMLSITMEGESSVELPGYLVVRRGAKSTGMAIGIETQDGKPQPINAPGNMYPYYSGDNVISLVAYLQAEPLAIKNKSIVAGAFQASALFYLNYN